jgi:protein-S-isoprenylcysteine O-methyltransferase Ste14
VPEHYAEQAYLMGGADLAVVSMTEAAELRRRARVVLDAVSVFPRHAETAVVADLVNGAIDAGLDERVEKGMLSLEGGIVQFRHELARRAIEASIAPARRRALHQKVVDVLQRRSDARASEIAHHAERAADVAALLKFAYRAGDDAARAGAPREAAAHFATMLRHRHALDSALVVEVLEHYAEQAYLMGGADLAVVSMTEAAELRRRANDTLGLGRDLTRLTRFAWMCGRRAEAERFVEEAIAVLQTAPPGPELAWAYSHQSQLDMLASRMDIAITWGERALVLARKRIVPEAAERSTYVLLSSLALAALYVCWEPIRGVVWSVPEGIARNSVIGLYLLGWLLLLYTTFLIDHFDLFGLKQVWRRLSNKAYRAPVFRTPSLYKLVRHPLYIGWLTIFWAAPTMTVAHLIFALATTAYILIAIRLEERDLVSAFGDVYVDYRARTPMLIPRLWSRPSGRVQREII